MNRTDDKINQNKKQSNNIEHFGGNNEQTVV